MANLKDKIRDIKVKHLVKPLNTEINKIYFKKGVFYGDYLDEVIYDKVKISHSNKSRDDYTKRMNSERRDFSLIRARQNIYRIVHANVYKHGNFNPIFCTLTYSKDQTSLSAARREYSYFIKKLNIHVGHKIQYICVPEIQKKREMKTGKAVWHFHAVIFNLPYIPILEFKSLWTFGSVDLQITRNIKDVGAYIAKYLTKDTVDSRLYGQRVYNTSQNVFRPIESFDDMEIDNYTNCDTVKLVDKIKTKSSTIKKWKKK